VSSAPAPRRPNKRYELLAGRTFGVLHLREGEASAPRVICLPHSGGAPHIFEALAEALPSTWSVRALDLPGHVRTQGAPLHSVDAMALAALQSLPTSLLEGAVLIGLSLGGYVARALARALAHRGSAPPALVVCATRPPHMRRDHERPSSLPTDALFRWLVDLGGMPGSGPEWLEIFTVFEPALRADLRAYETYDPGPDAPPPCPTLFIGGHDDTQTPPALFTPWAQQDPSARVEIVSGGHFALRDHPAEVAALVAPFVTAHWPGARTPD
jgi:surfactin synthase thioesterase subunit